jgi:hypothetical protein
MWGGPPPDGTQEQQYADLFADELPGANRRFSYDVDRAQQQARDDADPFDEEWDEPVRSPTKSRRRWFGRR